MQVRNSRLRGPILVVVFAFTSLPVACDSDSPTSLKGESEAEATANLAATYEYKSGEFENPYRWVGQIHNEALDYTLAEFEVFAEEHGTITPKRMRALGARHIRSYLQGRLTGNGTHRRALRWGFRHQPGLRLITKRAGFTHRQMNYLRKVRELTNWGDYDGRSPAPILQRLDELERDAVQELGQADARPVLLATAVSAHTIQYWNSYETRHRWKQVGYELLQRRQPAEVTLDADVGEEDVAGAIGGAAAAVVTGCGELSLGACVAAGAAAGAISASVAEAILHVL